MIHVSPVETLEKVFYQLEFLVHSNSPTLDPPPICLRLQIFDQDCCNILVIHHPYTIDWQQVFYCKSSSYPFHLLDWILESEVETQTREEIHKHWILKIYWYTVHILSWQWYCKVMEKWKSIKLTTCSRNQNDKYRFTFLLHQVNWLPNFVRINTCKVSGVKYSEVDLTVVRRSSFRLHHARIINYEHQGICFNKCGINAKQFLSILLFNGGLTLWIV